MSAIYAVWTDKDDDAIWQEGEPSADHEIYKRLHERLTRLVFVEGETISVTIMAEVLLMETYPEKFWTALIEIGADLRKAF